MTAQMAQSSPDWPAGTSGDELVFNPAGPKAFACEAISSAANCATVKLPVSCSPNRVASNDADAACALPPWKCPNDNRNWIASAKSARREPTLMFERNHLI